MHCIDNNSMKYHLAASFVGGLLLGVGIMLVYVRQNPQSRECMQAIQMLEVQSLERNEEEQKLGDRFADSTTTTAFTKAPVTSKNLEETRPPEEVTVRPRSKVDIAIIESSSGSRGKQAKKPWAATDASPLNATKCEFAYVVYVSNCIQARFAAIALRKLQSQESENVCVDFVVLVSESFELRGSFWKQHKLLVRKVESWKALSGDPTWEDSLTYLHVFGPQLYMYKRIVFFNENTWIRKRPDELFAVQFTGVLKVAAPKAYWSTKQSDDGVEVITPFLMVFEPNEKYWNALQEAYSLHMHTSLNADLVNRIWGGKFTIIDSVYAANTMDFESPTSLFYNSTLTTAPMIHFSTPALDPAWNATRKQVSSYIGKTQCPSKGQKLFKHIYNDIRNKYVLLKAKMLC